MVAVLVRTLAPVLAVVAGCSLAAGLGDYYPAGQGGSAESGGEGGAGGVGGTGGAGGVVVLCQSAEECPGNDEICHWRTCESGVCGMVNATQYTSCFEGGGEACDGEGNCKRANGTACSDGIQCASGLCADGVCCQSECSEVCHSCEVAGSEGICTVDPPRADPDEQCGYGLCDGAGQCAEGPHRWQATYGDNYHQAAFGVAAAESGSVHITGYANSIVDFGGGQLSCWGQDMFVAKLDESGGHAWSKVFWAGNTQQGNAVAVDSDDRVVLTGWLAGQVDFGVAGAGGSGGGGCAGGAAGAGGAGPSGVVVGQNAGSIALARFDADGCLDWAKDFDETNSPQIGKAVATDADGAIALAGQFRGRVDLAGGAIDDGVDDLSSAHNSYHDIFVAKFAPSGEHVWSKALKDFTSTSSYGDKAAEAVAIDSNGNVVVAGYVRGEVDLGAGEVTASGQDIFVAKYAAADGAHLWSQVIVVDGDQAALALASDGQDNVVLTGHLEGTVYFIPPWGGMVQGGSDDSAFVAKLGADGGLLWVKDFVEGAGRQVGMSVAVDARDNIALTGRFQSTLELGDGCALLDAGSTFSIFHAKLAADGTCLWSRQFGSYSTETWLESRAAVGPNRDDIWLAGWFAGSANFGDGPVSSTGGLDIFLVKYGP